MKQRLLNFAMMLLMAMTSMLTAEAQKTMDVSTFTRIDNDLMARVTKPVRDHDEGKLCALIRVVTNLTDLEVRADALGIVQQEKHAGELWLYVPYGARSLSFSHEGYFPLLYQYALAIEEGTVYELRLASFETNTDAMASNSNTQLFVLTHQPEEAKVFIDEMEVSTEYGVFAAMMNKGEHTYKVVADQYEDAEGSFTLDNQTIYRPVNLAPLFGTFQLFTLPENGFKVSINDQVVGVSPYKSEKLDPGSYRVRIEKDKYYPVDTLIRLREGDELQFTCRATSFADSLFYNRELGGRNISFGVNVGYVIPMVAASSGGGFTGSAINYSLGNERENASYSSQSSFKAGIFADIRLYKNFYLIAGMDYTLYRYKNTFDQPFDGRIISATNYEVNYATSYQNSYVEKYTHQLLDWSVLASYRFVLTKTGSIHVNMGPYVSYALSAKMDFSGSSEYSGEIYYKNLDNTIDFSSSHGTSSGSNHSSGDFNLFKRLQTLNKTNESAGSIGNSWEEETILDKSPFKRFNYGLKFGVAYELRGFQIGLNYSLQLSNMANDEFWESTRIPLFYQTGENVMSGYKHRLHSLEIKLGYVLRY